MNEPRDPHLLAALRHAPDHAATPPPQLSARILAGAQAAARGQRAAQRRVAWRRWWSLAQRPSVAGVFGSLVVATVVGVMWSTQAPPDATPGPRVESMPARRDAPAATAETAPTAVADAAVPGANRVADPPAAPAARPPSARAVAPAERSMPRTEAGGASVGPADALPAAPAVAALPTPPATQPSLAAAAGESTRDATTGRAVARDALGRAAAPMALGAAAKSEAADPLAAVARALDAAGVQARWQPPAPAPARAHDAVTRAWWAVLQRASAGAWQPAGAVVAGERVTLAIDGQLQGTLILGDTALAWRAADGSQWQAAVAPATLRELRETLSRW